MIQELLSTFDVNREAWLALIPVLPLLGFLFNAAFGKGLSLKASGGLATAAVFGSFLIAFFLFTGPLQDRSHIHSIGYSWIATAGMSVDFRLYLDNLSGIYMLVITGIGTLIHLYSIGYMSHDKAYSRFFTYLNLFIFSMLMLVLGNSLLTLFLGWEGVGLCSYLLIGFWYKDLNNTKAGMKAFIANRVGDFGFLVGMMLIFWHFNTVEYVPLQQAAQSITEADSILLNWACVCLFIGATGKSAQIPLYVWLPDAMAGPTPVSALIHAATMVTAGIYMCARMNFVFVHAESAMMMIAIVGGLTAVFSGSVALAQRDIKKTLAYSTVSQLGFMFMAVGLGAFDIAVFHVVTHAFFKALLFLGSGSVIHSLEHTLGHGHPDSQDMTKMGGLKEKMPVTFITMFVGALALAGLPLLAGFFSKDQILFAAFHRGDAFGFIIYGLGIIGAFCTALYSARLIGMTFYGKWRGEEKVYAHADESPRSMTIPLAVLALGSILIGYTWLPAFGGAIHFQPFQTWLQPVFAQGQEVLVAAGSHFAIAYDHTGALNAELISMAIGSAIAIAVFLWAFKTYRTNAGIEKMHAMVHTTDGEMKPPYKLLSNKYYVDEIYHAGIVKPLLVISEALWLVVDIFIIEMLCVQGIGTLAKTTSRVGRKLQTGVVRHYLYAFGVGAVFFMILFLVISAKSS